MQTMQSNLFYCKRTLHVSGKTAPFIRSAKNYNRSLWYCAATSLQRGQVGTVPTWPRWKEVAGPILWPVPEAAVTVFSTPDDGCCDTQNMYSDSAVK